MSYHVDRLYAAISVLVAHGPIKQRLIRAYEQHLEEIEEDELPLAVQEFFVTLRRMMHCVSPANGEGPICASVRKMSKVQADECAQLIIEIYGGVVRYADDARAPLPLVAEDSSLVPPFLVKSG
jgi:hypothetical protein